MRIGLILYLSLIVFWGCTDQKTGETKSANENIITNDLNYSIPQAWIAEQPKSKMRKAQYKIPGIESSEDAEMAVFVFPGTGGSVQANIDRWVGQFKQPDNSESNTKTETKRLTVNNLSVTTVYLKGTYLQSASSMMMGGPTEEKPEYAMLAAIVETDSDPWFFKMVGPQKTVDHWRPEFDKMVNTFK